MDYLIKKHNDGYTVEHTVYPLFIMSFKKDGAGYNGECIDMGDLANLNNPLALARYMREAGDVLNDLINKL